MSVNQFNTIQIESVICLMVLCVGLYLHIKSSKSLPNTIHIYMNKSKVLVSLLFLGCFTLSSTSFAQVGISVYAGNESYEKMKQRFQTENQNFPKYFFPFTNYGGNNSDEPLPPDVLAAVLWVVPVPVLVKDLQDDPYSLWLCNLAYTFSGDTLPKPNKVSIQKRLPRELEKLRQEANQPSEYERMEQWAPTKEEDKLARVQYLETHNKEVENKKQLVKLDEFQAMERTASYEIKNVYSDIPAFDAKSLKSNKKLKNISPQFSSIIDSLGVEASLQWLFQQQVIAGNIIFCDPNFGIPIPVKDEDQDKAAYVALLSDFVKDFGYAIRPFTSPEVKALKKNPAAFADMYMHVFYKNNVDHAAQYKAATKLVDPKPENSTTINTINTPITNQTINK